MHIANAPMAMIIREVVLIFFIKLVFLKKTSGNAELPEEYTT
jgi:hypothetical protein